MNATCLRMNATCLRCGRDVHTRNPDLPRENTYQARGLCTCCYVQVSSRGQLADYPRTTRTRDEVLEEWDWLRRAGVPFKYAHRRLGMTRGAFERALQRARAAGDRRAVLAGVA